MSNQADTVAEKAELNWEALSSDPIMGDPTYKPAEAPVEDLINKDIAETSEQKTERETTEKVASETKANEEKITAEKTALSAEAKNLGLPETSTKEEIEAAKQLLDSEIKITVADIENAPVKHAEGSYKALAQQLGHEIEEESIDSFKTKFIAKHEAEKLAKVTKETFFSTLKPEVAAALELKELGIPDELLLEPTKEIDGYLSLDAAELVRADKAATQGWTQEMIDTEIESLIESGKLDHEASKIRIELNLQKTNILAHKAELVKKYTEQNQNAILQQKEAERTQTITAFDKVQEFMGVKIPREVKEVLARKYANGAYDKDLMSPESKVDFILKMEYGPKITKYLQTKVAEKVKKENTDKLLNIPPVKEGGGGVVQTNNQTDNWGPIDEDFK